MKEGIGKHGPPLTWSIASCSITIAPSISRCCDAESGSHERVSLAFTARLIFIHTAKPSSHSFSGPGGNGARHKGQVSDTPFARSSATHAMQNEWPHGSVVGSRGASKQTRHWSASAAALQSRSCCAWAAAARTNAAQAVLWPPCFQCIWLERGVVQGLRWAERAEH